MEKRRKAKMGNRKIVFLILILFLSTSYNFPASQDTILYLRATAVNTVDPGKTTDRYSSEIISNIYEGLVKFRKNTSVIEPCLAEHWTVKDNGKRWLFYLKRGVKFHNGESFNAKAVEFTFNKRFEGKDYKYKKWYFYYSNISKIEAIDDFTVEIILKKPFTSFIYTLANPKAYIVAPSSYSGEEFDPIGTGPFVFSKWVKGRYLTIERNKKYWAGSVKISKVIFKLVKDAAWRILQLKNGKADISLIDSSKEYEEIRGRREIKILSAPSLDTHYLAFNTKKEPFKKLEIRKAFAHLLNKKSLIRHIFQDFAKNATTPIPPHIFGFNNSINDYDFDIKKAKMFLQKAGYNDGLKVKLYYSSSTSSLDELANRIKRNARTVNILIQKVRLPFANLRKAVDKSEHDILLMGWVGEVPDPDSFLYPTFTLKKGHTNRSFYNNPLLTKILEEARETGDPQKRKTLYFKAQQIIHVDIPWIPLYHLNNMLAFNKKIKNIYINQLSHLIFKDAYLEKK